MSRKSSFMAFREGDRAGPYDEAPLLLEDIDPQIHISRNDRPQPFFLICEKDNVLVQLSGTGKLHLKNSTRRYFNMKPGDHIYLPARVPHRYIPYEESLQLRYKAVDPGLEGVEWDCQSCGALLKRFVWDTSQELPQEGYLRALLSFNQSVELRTCGRCGEVHSEIDPSPFRWEKISSALRAGE